MGYLPDLELQAMAELDVLHSDTCAFGVAHYALAALWSYAWEVLSAAALARIVRPGRTSSFDVIWHRVGCCRNF
jgi:hypothetical protein